MLWGSVGYKSDCILQIVRRNGKHFVLQRVQIVSKAIASRRYLKTKETATVNTTQELILF